MTTGSRLRKISYPSRCIRCRRRREYRTYLLHSAVDVDVELLAEIEAHSIAKTLRARRVRWVWQRDERHSDGRAALAVGIADPVRSRVLRQSHQFIRALPRDELCFQILLPSSVQLHSHLTASSSSNAGEIIRHAGRIARRSRSLLYLSPLRCCPLESTFAVTDAPHNRSTVRRSSSRPCVPPLARNVPCARP